MDINEILESAKTNNMFWGLAKLVKNCFEDKEWEEVFVNDYQVECMGIDPKNNDCTFIISDENMVELAEIYVRADDSLEDIAKNIEETAKRESAAFAEIENFSKKIVNNGYV